MEKYNSNSRCPKCNSEHLMSEYISQEVGIMRKCTNCSYHFYQDALDKVDKVDVDKVDKVYSPAAVKLQT